MRPHGACHRGDTRAPRAPGGVDASQRAAPLLPTAGSGWTQPLALDTVEVSSAPNGQQPADFQAPQPVLIRAAARAFGTVYEVAVRLEVAPFGRSQARRPPSSRHTGAAPRAAALRRGRLRAALCAHVVPPVALQVLRLEPHFIITNLTSLPLQLVQSQARQATTALGLPGAPQAGPLLLEGAVAPGGPTAGTPATQQSEPAGCLAAHPTARLGSDLPALLRAAASCGAAALAGAVLVRASTRALDVEGRPPGSDASLGSQAWQQRMPSGDGRPGLRSAPWLRASSAARALSLPTCGAVLPVGPLVEVPEEVDRDYRERGALLDLPPGLVAVPIHLALGVPVPG